MIDDVAAEIAGLELDPRFSGFEGVTSALLLLPPLCPVDNEPAKDTCEADRLKLLTGCFIALRNGPPLLLNDFELIGLGPLF